MPSLSPSVQDLLARMEPEYLASSAIVGSLVYPAPIGVKAGAVVGGGAEGAGLAPTRPVGAIGVR